MKAKNNSFGELLCAIVEFVLDAIAELLSDSV